jgi:hypothetical protein
MPRHGVDCFQMLTSAGDDRVGVTPFVKKVKTLLLLNPAAKPLGASLAEVSERNSRWKLIINESVEFDS